jgi:hypothetical protein
VLRRHHLEQLDHHRPLCAPPPLEPETWRPVCFRLRVG